MIKVVAALIVDRGQILIAQRPPGDLLEYLWEFPGGKARLGEDPMVALAREVKEELGLLIAIDRWLGENTHTYDFGTIHLRLYLAHPRQGCPERRVHHQLAWVRPEHLTHYLWAPADIPFIAAIPQWLDEERV